MKTGLSILILLSLVLSGCSAPQAVEAPASPGWQHADLRMLFSDGETTPEYDLVAASVKPAGEELLVRLDVLDMQPETRAQVFLAVDDRPGGSRELPFVAQSDLEWDFLVDAPANTPTTLVLPDRTRTQGRLPWLAKNDSSDTLIFHLASAEINLEDARFQVFIRVEGTESIADSSPVFAFNAEPPAQAPLLLVFWNTLPAATAAQAMRRWNGAHTGPEGHRHGLYQILQAVQDSRVPVALLDLKNPESLAGLDLLGGLDMVREMQQDGLLLLPDLVYGDPQTAAQSLELTRRIATQYGLETSNLLYGPADAATAGQFKAAFSSPASTFQISDSTLRVPLPASGYETQSATSGGPSLKIRRALLAAAREGGRLVVLGGSLPNTPWADAVYAAPVLDYFVTHAWIDPLDEAGLLALPAERSDTLLLNGCADLLCSAPLAGDPTSLRAALQALPPGTGRDLALQMYLQLTQPTVVIPRAKLQAQLLPQVRYLIRAAQWAQQPTALSECHAETTGGALCILASQTQIALIHSQGARLVYLGSIAQGELRQWIGPGSQFAAGLGDASEWKLDAGEFSDPRSIPGALVDSPGEQEMYQAVASPGQVTFTAASGAQKTYRLEAQGLRVDYSSFPTASVQVPLAVLPNARQQPGWSERFRLVTDANGANLTWGIPRQASLRLEASVPALTSLSFFDAGSWLRQPEDPDHAYPPGHFQAIPLFIATYAVEGAFILSITLN